MYCSINRKCWTKCFLFVLVSFTWLNWCRFCLVRRTDDGSQTYKIAKEGFFNFDFTKYLEQASTTKLFWYANCRFPEQNIYLINSTTIPGLPGICSEFTRTTWNSSLMKLFWSFLSRLGEGPTYKKHIFELNSIQWLVEWSYKKFIYHGISFSCELNPTVGFSGNEFLLNGDSCVVFYLKPCG